MHCYACNILLTNPQLDKPTTRYYCDQCLEPTVEVQLRLAGKDYYEYVSEPIEETVGTAYHNGPMGLEVPYKEPKEDYEHEDF